MSSLVNSLKRGANSCDMAVVDVDTLWRNRADNSLFHWKGRACKGYTKVRQGWLLIFHTGLLDYGSNHEAIEKA